MESVEQVAIRTAIVHRLILILRHGKLSLLKLLAKVQISSGPA